VDKRTKARELAMQGLYQLDVQSDEVLRFLMDFFRDSEPDEKVCRLAYKWCEGAWENLKLCDKFITEATIKWEISRLSSVDRNILRLAVYQLNFCRDIPPKVVINEAIELAKKFSTEKSPAFVNGVLDAVLKKIALQEQGS
jgi:transcription antitermination factor NusB